MSDAALALAGAVALLAFLLLALHLRSGWRWQVKAAATALCSVAVVALFLALQASLGRPVKAPLPGRFHFHAAVIEEPDPRAQEAGAIFVWVSRQGPDGPEQPRAHALPYSRELHERLVEAMGRMAEGARLEGRPRAAREQGYSLNAGGFELFEAPPPMPPPKAGS